MTERTKQEPAEYEDAETQAEWEHMARIRAETAKPVPYLPGDRL